MFMMMAATMWTYVLFVPSKNDLIAAVPTMLKMPSNRNRA